MHKHPNERKIKPAIAIGVLFVITIVASSGAFFWLQKVKSRIHVQCGEGYEGLCIEEITYLNNGKLEVSLFNGLEEPIRVLNSNNEDKTTDTTFISMMTGATTGIGCEFIPLGELDCDEDGICNGYIKSKEISKIILDPSREKCKVPGAGDYYLQINFGLKDQVREEFTV